VGTHKIIIENATVRLPQNKKIICRELDVFSKRSLAKN